VTDPLAYLAWLYSVNPDQRDDSKARALDELSREYERMLRARAGGKHE
jgi:hypothetical protein